MVIPTYSILSSISTVLGSTSSSISTIVDTSILEYINRYRYRTAEYLQVSTTEPPRVH